MKKADEREKQILASRKLGSCSNPNADVAAGRLMPLPVALPGSRSTIFFYAPSLQLRSTERKYLESLKHVVTSTWLTASNSKSLASVVYVPRLSVFLATPPDILGWRARFLGAGCRNRSNLITIT